MLVRTMRALRRLLIWNKRKFLVGSLLALAAVQFIRWRARMCETAFAYYLESMNAQERAALIEHRLRQRAAENVASLSPDSAARAFPEALDLVLSGGGFKNCYSAGVALALKLLYAKHNRGEVRRIAGASAGAQVALGIVNESYGAMLLWCMSVAATIQKYPLMQPFPMWRHFWHRLAQLSVPPAGKLHVSITRLGWYGEGFFMRNSVVSDFVDADDLGEALLSSGALPWVLCEGLVRQFRGEWVTDGGATQNTPVFRDGVRPQLIVRFGHLPRRLQKVVYFSNDEMLQLVERGMDDLTAFVRDGPAAAPNLTLLR